MKRKFLFIFLFLILSFNLVSSVEISVKDNLKKGENFVIKISGNFVQPLTKNNINFYRQYMQTSMGIFDIKNIEGDYYVYFEIPLEKLADQYSITLEDIQYRIGRDIKTDDVSANFTILNETAPFSISPSLIVAHDKYEIEIQNLMTESIELGLERKIKTVEELEESGKPVESGGFLNALFGLFSNIDSNENTTENETAPEIPEEEYSDSITLKSGEVKTLTYTAPEKKGFESIEFFYSGEDYGFLVYNPEDRIDKKPIENISDNETTSNKTIIFGQNGTNETLSNKTNVTINNSDFSTKSCVAMGGSVCVPEKEKCSGELRDSMSGKCCIGECKEISVNSNKKIIGWTIILIIALLLTWFFKKKYKSSGPGKINLFKIAKGK